MATTTTLASAIKTVVSDMVSSADYAEAPLRSLIPEIQNPGGDSYDWIIRSADNAQSVTYVEGDAVGADGNATFATASVPYTGGYIRTPFSVTGHALDFCKNGNFDPMLEELQSAMRAHVHKAEGLTVTAVEAAIDSAGTYGGLTRSSYNLASYEADPNTTTALSHFATMWTALQTDPLIAPVQEMEFLAGITVLNGFSAVAAGVQYNEYNQQRGTAIDPGKLSNGLAYNGRPFRFVPTMTSGTCLFVDPRKNLLRVISRRIEVVELAVIDDSVRMVIQSGEITVCKNPRFAGKLTRLA